MSDRAIADHALLSDSHGAALVTSDGSIDWLALVRFDAPSVFGRLLGERAGHWWLGTTQPAERSRRYLDDTMVLETEHRTDDGVLVVTDAMVFRDTEEAHDLGTDAPHALVRRVRVTEGSVVVGAHYEPRPEYGLMVPLLRAEPGGIYSRGGSQMLVLSATVPGEITDSHAEWEFRLEAGEEAWFALRRLGSATDEPQFWDRDEMAFWLEQTIGEWRSWSAVHGRYDGPYRDLVLHSGRVLQSLTYWPTGAIVAAPTTSLPEYVGGERNWDYRYSWVRDTALTLQALWVAACPKEAERYLRFLTRTAGGDLHAGEDLQIMYGVGGEHETGERILPHLPGWRGSAPVRVGNDAWHQRQLDVYGELLDAFWLLRDEVGELHDVERRFLRELADAALERWEEPDHGIWEMRDEPRHHLHSKLMCWVALDRAIDLADRIGAEDRLEDWTAGRQRIREAIETRGWNDEIGAFTQSFGSDALDASLLTMPLVRFLPADDERMYATIRTIERDLTDDHGLVFRYRTEDGLPGHEGTFLLCTFWLAECYAIAGDDERARAVFERAAAFANDVGLLSEEVDAATGELLGNFPQGFSHIGLINAAWAIGTGAAAGSDGQ